jgi:hypothetical protein
MQLPALPFFLESYLSAVSPTRQLAKGLDRGLQLD